MHKVLERQINKVFGGLENIPKGLDLFLTVISDSYDHADADRLLLERSIDISSRELSDINKELKKEAERIQTSLMELEVKNKLMLDKELEMAELKKEVAALKTPTQNTI